MGGVDAEEEIERVAMALWHSEAMQYADIPVSDWVKVQGYERENFRREARAAIKVVDANPNRIKICGAEPELRRRMWEGEKCILPPDHGPLHDFEDNPGTIHRAVRDDGLSMEFWTFPEGYKPKPLTEVMREFWALQDLLGPPGSEDENG